MLVEVKVISVNANIVQVFIGVGNRNNSRKKLYTSAGENDMMAMNRFI